MYVNKYAQLKHCMLSTFALLKKVHSICIVNRKEMKYHLQISLKFWAFECSVWEKGVNLENNLLSTNTRKRNIP